MLAALGRAKLITISGVKVVAKYIIRKAALRVKDSVTPWRELEEVVSVFTDVSHVVAVVYEIHLLRREVDSLLRHINWRGLVEVRSGGAAAIGVGYLLDYEVLSKLSQDQPTHEKGLEGHKVRYKSLQSHAARKREMVKVKEGQGETTSPDQQAMDNITVADIN